METMKPSDIVKGRGTQMAKFFLRLYDFSGGEDAGQGPIGGRVIVLIFWRQFFLIVLQLNMFYFSVHITAVVVYLYIYFCCLFVYHSSCSCC